MRASTLAAALALGVCAHLRAHDVSTTPITWNREISRIFYDRCVSCHRPDGTSFSLMTYPDVQPRAVAIRDRIANYVIPELNAVALARHRVHHQRASAIELHGKRPQPPRLPWAGISAGTVVTGKWWSFRWVAGENLPPASPGHEDVHGESDYRQFLEGRPVSDTLEYL